MDLYKENNCRICKKVFCCKKCREKHEFTVHEVLMDCDICIYGEVISKGLPRHLEKHIKNKHWPLHCKYCNQIFRTWDELIKQNRCLKEHNQFFDKRCVLGEEKYESPPTGQQTANVSYFLNLATSTPLQGIENFSKETDQEIITPVEYSGPNKEKKFDCSALKRKVTFCETSTMDSSKIQIKKEYNSENFNSVSQASDYSPSPKFYSTAQYLQENVTPEANENKITVDIRKAFASIKNSEIVQENTLWVSAINTSPAVVVDENKLSIDEYFTPVLLKEKKRQINVVAPTIVERELTLDSPRENTSESPRTQLSSDQSSVDEENRICTPFPSNSNDKNVILYETTKINQSGLWPSVTRWVQNVTNAVQELSNVKYDCGTPFKTPKRYASEYDSKDGPRIKRYKYTEIKCRPPIRDSYAEAEYSGYRSCSSDYGDLFEIPKTFADKAVQTDE